MADKGYLVTGSKNECYGCEACVQSCSHNALTMIEDSEGFRYPVLNPLNCVDCNLCHKVCPAEGYPVKNTKASIAFGGYVKDQAVRKESTSGGAFSAIVDAWCTENYAIFGAVADGLGVLHTFIENKALLSVFRKSKYSQSVVGNSFSQVRNFLKAGKSVVFSGTPCQIAGLVKYLSAYRTDTERLLTIEVVCEGVPSPLYLRKLDKAVKDSQIVRIDYRYKETSNINFRGFRLGIKDQGKWDFEVMRIERANGIVDMKDRWFNPFWSVWLKHLMSRPSCYNCPAATPERVADISLGDLWGVHLYCPELYGHNGGASLVVANTSKGAEALNEAKHQMYGHDLSFDDAIRYQGPMRGAIKLNPHRQECMSDLENDDMTFDDFNAKWADRPSLRLLFNKYIWGNRQKVALYNLLHKYKNR